MVKGSRKFGLQIQWRLCSLLLSAALLVAAIVLTATAGSSTPTSAETRQDARGAPNHPSRNDIYVSGPRTLPQLMFACCNQAIMDVNTLFADSAVLANLKTLHAGLVVALEDLSPARAQLVRRFNQAGIPVIAWLTLPPEQGYFVNASNAPQAAARFAQFDNWTRENDLHWQAVGLDIEPNFGEFHWPKWRLAWTLLRRAFDGQRVWRSRRDYGALIHEMQAHRYRVQTYQLIFLADERKVHSTMLERLFGLVDVRGDEEVLMTYTSFNHKVGEAMVWSYGRETQTLAVGSTQGSGNVQTDAKSKFRPLNWEEFSRAVIVASHFSRTVGVYDLEGCVQQGFLPRLVAMDWNQGVTIPSAAVSRIRRFRFVVQTVLWTASHALYFATIFLIAIAWFFRARRRVRVSVP
jgi:hypothetical protein